MPPGAIPQTVSVGNAAGPAAIGDISGSGRNEAVAGFGTYALAYDMGTLKAVLAQDVGANISAALTLGDFDLDGDEEIVVPTTTGDLYLYQGNGSLFPGSWPYTSLGTSRLSSAAIGQCLGTSEPEIAVAEYFYKVHLLYAGGQESPNYPVENDGWYIPGGPVMGHVDGSSSDIVIGARGAKAWDQRDADQEDFIVGLVVPQKL